MTLERHIDHVARQLEESQRNNNLMATERDQIYDELVTFKGIANNQEANKTELQREISRSENEKISLNQRILESERDLQNLKSQLGYEKNKFKELESMLEKERRSTHTNMKTIGELETANRDLKQEVER